MGRKAAGLNKKTQGKKRLTPIQQKLVELLAENPNLTLEEAGVQAGYKSSPRQHAHATLKNSNVNAVWRELMDKDPRLQDRALLDKLAQGLEAEKTQFFAEKGEVKDERTCVDFPTRGTYLDLAAKIKGGLAPARQELTGANGEPLDFGGGADLSGVPKDKLLRLIDKLLKEDDLPPIKDKREGKA